MFQGKKGVDVKKSIHHALCKCVELWPSSQRRSGEALPTLETRRLRGGPAQGDSCLPSVVIILGTSGRFG